MKKLFTILILAAVFASCKKADKPCWHCTFGTTEGRVPPPVDVCGELPTSFTDADGNSLAPFCEMK